MGTIVAIATPVAIGSIGIVRISGEDAFSLVKKIFIPISGKDVLKQKGYTSAYGHVVSEGEVVDEVIVHFFQQPRSYTGEDVVEISCHGGIYLVQKVLQLVLQQGARLAQSGEFTKRAILNGKMSLTQAEGVADLIQAQTAHGAKAAMSAREGVLYETIQKMREKLVEVSGHISAFIDYPEEDIADIPKEEILLKLKEVKQVLVHLSNTHTYGSMVKHGIKTLLIGRANSGKSSLMNALARREKSIVTPIAGTTRDVVEESIVLGNVILHLLDTAGIRETTDQIEQIGKEMALANIQTAQLILVVLDGSDALTEDDRQVLEKTKDCVRIGLINKSDLPQKIELEEVSGYFAQMVFLSAKEKQGLERLESVIEEVLQMNHMDLSQGMIANERQKQAVDFALKNVISAIETVEMDAPLDAVSFDIEMSIDSILQLSGEKVTDTVIDEVFKNFCVGK